MGGPGENGQTPPDDEDQGTVYVQGSGDATVTVESYSTDVDTSGATAAGSWLDYAVEKHKVMKHFAADDLRGVRKGDCCAMKYSSPFHFTTCDAILRGCKINRHK